MFGHGIPIRSSSSSFSVSGSVSCVLLPQLEGIRDSRASVLQWDGHQFGLSFLTEYKRIGIRVLSSNRLLISVRCKDLRLCSYLDQDFGFFHARMSFFLSCSSLRC